MIIFWSWQSDSPRQTGHYFVRDALREAIEHLKADHELLEPAERDAAASMTLDSDRQGVPGSPDLAATIFEKIERADVFVADVTLIGQTPDGKKLINSNVAIEYGHAHRALTSKRVLMVQNRHYGDGGELPFDLRQKSWPLHFDLAPDSTKAQIASERAKLRAQFVAALRPYLSMAGPSRPGHEPIPSTFTKAVFHAEGEILARNHAPAPDTIDYHFAQRRGMYLRLMPVAARDADLKLTRLHEDVLNRRVDLLLRNGMAAAADRNAYGAIAYEPHGTATEPRAFTQLFENGELWAVTTEIFMHHRDDVLVHATNVRNIFGRVLENFVGLSDDYGNGWPLQVVMGGVGLRGVHLSVGRHYVSQPIHLDEREIEVKLSVPTVDAIRRAVGVWLDELYEIASVREADRE
ncbi:hypothetical protein ACQR1W_12610 [Bradyrhizobium sp. HKCCYLS1011]|uniref:hypothetical protein n=1 Tax=Bradyrhizobium sp. HKCCYLS1011 TaxID=3420733 RepID=UPI003EBEFA7E